MNLKKRQRKLYTYTHICIFCMYYLNDIIIYTCIPSVWVHIHSHIYTCVLTYLYVAKVTSPTSRKVSRYLQLRCERMTSVHT